MRGFFELPGVDRALLVALLSYAAACFLPWWREMQVAGMAVFGWLMAALMLLSPAAAIFVLFKQKGRAARRGGRGR
jgi:hypothetical protein